MNYCKDCIYLRINSIFKEEEVPPYIPGEKRENMLNFICGLLSTWSGFYLGNEIKESIEALDIAFPYSSEPIGHIFVIQQQDKFGCNLFKKKG